MPLETSPLLFGVELEQLPDNCSSSECDDCYGSGEMTVECEYGHEHEVACDSCNGRGHFDSDNEGAPDHAIDIMRNLGLTTHSYMHCYHCDCEECAPFRREPLLAAQEDGTVGIEWVSRAMRSPRHLERIIEGHEAVMQGTGWTPDGYESAGNHIHVGIPKDVRNSDTAQSAYLLAAALVVNKEWERLADGGCGRLRGYNSKGVINHNNAWPYNGSYIVQKRGGATFEYRMWNTPSDPWRIAAHAGLSMAMTLWALEKAMTLAPDGLIQPNTAITVAEQVSLFDITDQWLPTNWVRRDQIIELVTTSGQ